MLDKIVSMNQLKSICCICTLSDFSLHFTLFFFSQQDVPLAGIVRSISGASAIVPVLPQWDSPRVWPEEAHDGSPGWGDWYDC